jgi:hypothetical protein
MNSMASLENLYFGEFEYIGSNIDGVCSTVRSKAHYCYCEFTFVKKIRCEFYFICKTAYKWNQK